MDFRYYGANADGVEKPGGSTSSNSKFDCRCGKVNCVVVLI